MPDEPKQAPAVAPTNIDQLMAAKPAEIVQFPGTSAMDRMMATPVDEQLKAQQEQGEADPGELRAPTKDELVAMQWEHFTGGIFSSGPRARPPHEEGVKTEWSDLPHMVGGLVAEMALNPGNIEAAASARALPAAATTVSRGYAGYMLAQSLRQAKGLYGELQNPDVTGAQKTFDTFAYTLQTVLGLALGKGPTKMKFETGISDLKSAHAAMPAEEANAFAKEMHGKTPIELAQFLQQKAAEAKTPEQQELLTSAAQQAKHIADMEPAAVKKLSEAHKAWDDVLRVFAPSARGPKAEQTAASLREHGGELAQRADRAEAALSGASKKLMAIPEEYRWDAVDRIERGVPQANEDLQGFADTARKIMDTKRDEIRALGTGKLEHFIEDYFPHIWEDPEAAEAAFARMRSKTPMLGSRSFLKERTIPTIAEGLELGLKPISTNPVDLLLAKGREMDRYIVGQKWMQEMKDREMVQFVRSGEKPPLGYTEIDDSIATVYGPRTGAVVLPSTETTYEATGGEIKPFGPEDVHVLGQRIMGKYYAPEEIATVANNYLSPGLRKSAAFRGYLSLANSVNQFQLGFSFFHLGFTTIDVATSRLALALEYGVQGVRMGNLGMVGKAAAKAASVPLSPITNIMAGSRGMAEWLRPGSQGEEIAKGIDMYRMGGGRAKMDKFYQATMWKQMQNALKIGTEARAEGKTGEAAKAYASAAWRAPFALVEQLGWPLMEYIVPRQKIGVALDMMRLEMERMPASASVDQVRAAADKVVNSVDNRMGQMVYDNLFWNKIVKDLSMATVRSVGWNIGTIREIGGGIVDTVKAGKQITFGTKTPVKPTDFETIGEDLGGLTHLTPTITKAARVFSEKGSVLGREFLYQKLRNQFDRPEGGEGAYPGDEAFERLVNSMSTKIEKRIAPEILRQRNAEFTHRMAYTIALPLLSGMIGATYQYLKTGKGPKELKDYYFPKTGEIDPQGREVRMQFPTYMKDVYHYTHDPMGTFTGKVHPMLGTIREMLMNEDYFDRPIRNSDDPFVKQVADEMSFAVKQFAPISVRQFETSTAAKQTASERAGAFVGVVRAPAWAGESSAEQLAAKLAGDKFKGASSPDTARIQQIQQAKLLFRQGKEDEANAILDGMEDAEQLTPAQRKNIEKGTEHSFLENAVTHLDAKEAMRVFKQATPEERESIGDMVQTKIDKAHLPEEDRDALQAQFDRLTASRDINTSYR